MPTLFRHGYTRNLVPFTTNKNLNYHFFSPLFPCIFSYENFIFTSVVYVQWYSVSPITIKTLLIISLHYKCYASICYVLVCLRSAKFKAWARLHFTYTYNQIPASVNVKIKANPPITIDDHDIPRCAAFSDCF